MYTRIMNKRTFLIMRKNRKICHFPVMILKKLQFLQENQFISEIIGTRSGHDEYFFLFRCIRHREYKILAFYGKNEI